MTNRLSAIGAALRRATSRSKPEVSRREAARRRRCYFDLRERSQLILQPQPHLAGELRLIGEHIDDSRVEPAFEQRQQLGAHPIAGNGHVGVGFILDVRNADAPRGTAAARDGGRTTPAAQSGRGADECRPAPSGRRRATASAETSRPGRRAYGRARPRRPRASRARAQNKRSGRCAPRSRSTGARAGPGPRCPHARPRPASRTIPPARTENCSSRPAVSRS